MQKRLRCSLAHQPADELLWNFIQDGGLSSALRGNVTSRIRKRRSRKYSIAGSRKLVA